LKKRNKKLLLRFACPKLSLGAADNEQKFFGSFFTSVRLSRNEVFVKR
jgi:hypothetical protein